MDTLYPYGVNFTYIVQWRDMDMKRIFSILLITVLLLGLTPLMGTVALAEEYATVTSTNGYGVRMREGPSKGYGVVTKLDVGTTVVVLQTGTEWSQIQAGETVGWMLNEFLNFGSTGSSDTSVPVTGVAEATVVSGNGLRVWMRATAGGKRLQLYSPGTAVTVLERGDRWCRIAIGGKIGYMMTEFLSFTQPPAPASLTLTSVSINYDYPVVGDVMEVTVEPADATVKYSWKVDGVELGTEPTFSVLNAYYYKRISVTVTGIGAYKGTLTDTALADTQLTRAIKAAHLSTLTPVVGDVLTVNLQPSSAVVEYSWRVGGVEVSTDATYTVTEADVGKMIQLKVNGIEGYTGAAACSASKEVVSDKELQSVTLSNYYPVIGETVTAAVSPAGAPVTYVWEVDGEVVSHAASYTVQPLQLGKQLKVTVTGIEPFRGTVVDSTERVAKAAITGVSIDPATPVSNEEVEAYVTPANASATFEWFADGVSLNKFGSTLMVDPAWAGQKLSVVATGTGVYSNVVTSAQTAPVIDHQIITGVAIDNTSPVVGDTLTAKLTPNVLNEGATPPADDMTYVWYIDTQVAAGHGRTYTVAPSDAGKVIRVKVVGTGSYTGEVYSGYTNAVVETKDIRGVSMLNDTTSANAAHTSPEVGQTLYAQVDPGQATVTYLWVEQSSGNVRSTTDSYTLQAIDAGKRIVLTVEGTGAYKGEKSVTSATVLGLTPLTADLGITAPVAGMPPVTSVSEKDVFTGSIQWLNSDYSPAELDSYGHFKPTCDYIAAVTITPAKGYTMQGAAPTNGGVPADKVEGNIAYFTFSTGAVQVTDYYIGEIPTPIVGNEAVLAFETTQYSGTVDWGSGVVDGMFASKETFTAQIVLDSTGTGYELAGLPDNIFQVGGASQTTYDSATQTVTAVFEIDRTVTISTDKEVVYLDGYNNVYVQCSFEVSNYTDGYTYMWEVEDATVNATKIDPYGLLTIGMYETPERALTVRVTVTLDDGTEYVATKQIQLLTGEETDTAIQVVFIDAPSMVKRGNSIYFNTITSNSTQGCNLWAFYSETDYEYMGFNAGYLNVPASRPQKKVVIKAISVEDSSVVASAIVDIVDISVSFVESVDSIERGFSGYFKAKAEYSTQGCILYAIVDGVTVTIGENEGELKIGTEVEADYVTVYAVSKENTSIVASKTVNLNPPMGAAAEAGIMTLELGDEDLLPAAGEDVAPATEAEPAVEAAPAIEAEPAVEAAPAIEAEPAVEAAPAVEEQPAVEAAPAVEEQPAVEAAPAVEEQPAVEAAPAVEEQPAVEADPAVEEQPATEAEPVVEPEPEEDDVDLNAQAGIMTLEAPVVEAAPAEQQPAAETEPAVEAQPTVEEEPEEETEGVQIAIVDTVTGEVVEEQPTEEEPAQEEPEEEETEGVEIAIVDTVTGEIVEEQPTEEEPKEEPKAESSKKSDDSDKDDEPVAETEDEEIPDPELDDVEGDKDVGESTAESTIKIRFVEMESTVKRGHTAQFSVEIEGSEQGVRWSVRRSKDADGKKVSSISQDGVLTVSGAETADKLVVVATSVEDGTVRARWIVTIKNPVSNNDSDSDEEEIEQVNAEEPVEDEIVPSESETTVPTLPEEEDIVVEPETEGLTEEQLQQVEEELDEIEEQTEVVGLF